MVALEAQQEVHVQAALVHLVDHDGVVAAKQTVLGQLGQQHAVRQHPQACGLVAAVVETDLTAHHGAQRNPQLGRDALSGGPCSQPARLRVGDLPLDPVAHLQQHLGQLRGLAAARVRLHHHHLAGADGRLNGLALCGHRQFGGIGGLHRGRSPRGTGPRASLLAGIGLRCGHGGGS